MSDDTITVTAPVAFNKWQAPSFASPAQLVKPRQGGISPNPGVPVAALPQAALDALAGAWLADLYTKAGKSSPWKRK